MELRRNNIFLTFQTLASEFDTRAVHLVNLGYNNRVAGGPLQSNESMAKTAQVRPYIMYTRIVYYNTIL